MQNQKPMEAQILEKLQGKDQTPANTILAGQSVMSELIYQQYPSADPKVVEALLLMFQNQVGELLRVPTFSQTNLEQLVSEMQRFGNALDKTIEMLNQN